MKCLICGADVDFDAENEPRICEIHWKCPKCGAGTEYKYEDTGELVEGFVDQADGSVTCARCDGLWGYREVEKAIMKKESMVKCPLCAGKGAITKKKAEKFKSEDRWAAKDG